jgi:hypothetical protein
MAETIVTNLNEAEWEEVIGGEEYLRVGLMETPLEVFNPLLAYFQFASWSVSGTQNAWDPAVRFSHWGVAVNDKLIDFGPSGHVKLYQLRVRISVS